MAHALRTRHVFVEGNRHTPNLMMAAEVPIDIELEQLFGPAASVFIARPALRRFTPSASAAITFDVTSCVAVPHPIQTRMINPTRRQLTAVAFISSPIEESPIPP